MLKAGDKVAVLDEDMEGKVLSVSGSEVQIETSEGFLMSFSAQDLVKIEAALPDMLPPEVENFSEVIKEKEASKKRKSVRLKPKERNQPPMEVDLHIGKLVPKTGGLSNYEILNIQMDTARRQLEFAISKRIQKIVFIHGVGEGVLRAELETLFHRYENIKFYDADYQKYGLGATEVYIFQNY
ncbi:DNA mismatch repair protein MutS [Salinimicrobium tongyeongense]|uniref:DNA mismatch repair protein MutS n=1 Tax=Salinimicrobium tongyeongense TaxID=2809707 RepID=A0ABY6NVA3_9FLAO|nr:Smr/MutS family protein [Salinimicrobium tongyeongense]UZH56862.1 DNA mismatch repair protein MutS [Salinimicrobium tongyeongense]